MAASGNDTAIGGHPSEDSGQWLRLLLHVLTGVDRIDCVSEGVLAWNLRRMKRPADRRGRYHAQLHSHENLEICAAVRGRGIVDIGTTRYRLEAPSLVVIGPGVPHSEGYLQQRHSYATAWISRTHPQRLTAQTAHYRPGLGWACPWLADLPRREQRALMRWFLSPGRVLDEAWFERLRAHLLAALGELARQSHSQPSPPRSIDGVSAGHRKVLAWVRHYLDRHYAQPFTLDEVAAMTRYSPKYLDTLFARWTGRGIRAYAIDRRMERALRLCQETDLPIQQVAATVGYADPLYFSRAFRHHHGCSPTEARQGR